jgi:integrase/recombinase XerD
MHSTAEILQYWADFMAAQDLTARTIEERVRFIYHVETNAGSVLEVTRYDLIRYLGLDPSWTNSTKQHYRSALHTFFTWLQDEGFRPDNPGAKLPKVKARKRTPTPFSRDEIELILCSGAYRKTRMMVALHYYLGLRVSEIARVHGGRDISWTNRTLTTVGKGEKKVTLPLNDAMWEIAKGMPRDGYWFPNWKANRLFEAGEGHILGNSVSTIIGNAIRRAGIVGHRPHDLRASTATLQSRAGVDPFIVQKNMRHESMDTTTNYRLVDPDEQREGFEALPVVFMPERSGRRRRTETTEEPRIAA